MGFSGGGTGLSSGMNPKTEVSVSTAVHDISSASAANALMVSALLTVPSVEQFYKIKAVTYRVGGVSSGNVQVGVAIIDATPPVSVNMQIVAWSAVVAQGAINTDQRIELDVGKGEGFILGRGQKVVILLIFSDAIGTARFITVGLSNVFKAWGTFTFRPFDTTVWSTSTVSLYGILHLIPYGT